MPYALSVRFLALSATLLCLAAALAADVPARIGGGNIPVRGDEAKFKALQALGAGMCRIPVDGRAYWNAGRKEATPAKADAAVLMAREHGVTPMLLFEYYTRWHGELGGYEKWFAIGKAFAGRFAPGSEFLESRGIAGWGVTTYTAVNEPMWRANNPEPIDPNAYARALEGLADGVHSVSGDLRVCPGGFQEVPLFQGKCRYLKPIVPLLNGGKLWGIDIHRYWDVDYVPMHKGRRFSLQAQFDLVKKREGITANIHFHTTEMNFKKRKVTEDQAARGLLTALWDALTVVGNEGNCVSDFVLPWNIFHTTEKDTNYGLCTQLEPWTPTARGRVLRAVCRLSDGMEIVRCDPRGTGVTVLAGGGRRMWVWQNRKGWTNRPGERFQLADIPAGTQAIEVHAWDGLRKTVPTTGKRTLTITDLAPDQTYMFVTAGDQPN